MKSDILFMLFESPNQRPEFVADKHHYMCREFEQPVTEETALYSTIQKQVSDNQTALSVPWVIEKSWKIAVRKCEDKS
ncbi:hypothetical protein AJ78_07546 [Emergomyces pasteurianus Ep9510]|uniref:Uncharacterized protein n=1 Tax=Emergomyces pasteurianus Ep9510 TaxID=1447872 RepID=A0A1J9P4U9_9EURO|nr:hypothetical protein AJ78_07546 [Emergomyces pasteurianus Ep9510]